ncbi:MAG: hypothetical protein MK077_10180 [Phycisphaerales bacterium]|nr:hypothetical protein [Phycisphaerales bacterium]
MFTLQMVAIMLIVLGLSNVLWSGTWADFSMNMLGGRTPAGWGMLGGSIALLAGLAIVLSKPPQDGFLIIGTIVGWLMIAKGSLWLVLPPLVMRMIPQRASTFAMLNVIWGVLAIAAGGVLIWAIDQSGGLALLTP